MNQALYAHMNNKRKKKKKTILPFKLTDNIDAYNYIFHSSTEE
jgi:hypothetical protein